VDHKVNHSDGWLTNDLESSISEVNVPTVDGSPIVCFESHLVAGLGLPPIKFLVAIMNFLGCELVHFNPNTIAALSCFSVLCECWLGIAPDTSLFCHFYSLAQYDKVIYSGTRLSLRRHHQKDYIKASFKGSWNGATHKWLLVDMHVASQWTNRHFLPLHIDNKRGEPKMTPCLAALVKRVAELREAGLQACHYVEEFTLQRIHPLDHQEKLTYECLWLTDPCREPGVGKIYNSSYCR
jgi:hypothetical protein